MSNTTVIIKTIGRPTLKAAIASAKREGLKPIVISDGVNCHAYGEKFVKLGRQWGFYGGMAANVGAALAETPYITFLDDDDVFLPGAGKIIESKTTENPEVDIWIAGVRFNREVALHNTQTGEETEIVDGQEKEYFIFKLVAKTREHKKSKKGSTEISTKVRSDRLKKKTFKERGSKHSTKNLQSGEKFKDPDSPFAALASLIKH